MSSDSPLSSTEAALRERVKELTCLYGMAQLAGKPGVSQEEILQGIVDLLPGAWQHADFASARIVLEGRSYTARGFRESRQEQAADIVISGTVRGSVEVVYVEPMPELDEGPFLQEERHLINAVARQIAFIIERRQAEEEKLKLYDQLRHADRLATIGVLAAGVAHELNEPLGSILGFAQLAKKCPGLPERARQDIEKIETASLDAREVIKSLLAFTRQTPPETVRVNLNQVVKKGFSFFERQCAEGGVELVYSLAPDLPEITANPTQLNHVLVNLVVNALQAMPEGGTLTVQTRAGDRDVFLIVDDTGIGMSPEVCEQVFVPFFTTKDASQGTGLGLPVVHGIVSAHGGTIRVESQVGRGTRFEIRLPATEPGVEEPTG